MEKVEKNRGAGRPTKIGAYYDKGCKLPSKEDMQQLCEVLGYRDVTEMVYFVFLNLINEKIKQNEITNIDQAG